MGIEINSIQIAAFYSTSFDRHNKLDLANKLISSSDGIFSVEGLEFKTDLPDFLSGPAWLILKSQSTGYEVQVADEKLSVIWSRVSQSQLKSDDEVITFALKFINEYVTQKESVKRLGFVRQYINGIDSDRFKERIFAPALLVGTDDFQATIIRKRSEKLTVKPINCNLRLDIARINYRRKDDESLKSGVMVTIDSNSSQDEDLDARSDSIRTSLKILSDISTPSRVKDAVGLDIE